VKPTGRGCVMDTALRRHAEAVSPIGSLGHLRDSVLHPGDRSSRNLLDQDLPALEGAPAGKVSIEHRAGPTAHFG
jgi:hypothetical protein